MSTSFRQIRKNSTAQGRFKDLVRDFQRFQAGQVTVDNPDFKVKLRTMYSKLVYSDPFFNHKTKSINTVFYMPFEPDTKSCVGMWNLNHNGRFSIDSSGLGNYGRWTENPKVKEGIDDGFGTSLYADFDGFNTIVYVDNFPSLRLSFVPKFSITARIYPTDISASDGPGGTMYRTILYKADTTLLNGSNSSFIDSGSVGNAYHLAVTPDGRVRFTLGNAGVKYTVQTSPNVIDPSDPPFPYDITVTVNQTDKVLVPVDPVTDPGEVPGTGDDAEPETQSPTLMPRMMITVNNAFFALYTNTHLHFTDDGSFRRLRIGTTFTYSLASGKKAWFKWKGGIQQVRLYSAKVLNFNEIMNLHFNKITLTEMPPGSPALAGSVIVMDPSLNLGYDIEGYDEGGYEATSTDINPTGFPGMDPLGYDEDGFDTLPITNQADIQQGGYNTRGYSPVGYHTLPFSQS